MSETAQIIVVGIFSGVSCWAGYSFGYWRCNRQFKNALRILANAIERGKDESETVRKKNDNKTG